MAICAAIGAVLGAGATKIDSPRMYALLLALLIVAVPWLADEEPSYRRFVKAGSTLDIVVKVLACVVLSSLTVYIVLPFDNAFALIAGILVLAASYYLLIVPNQDD